MSRLRNLQENGFSAQNAKKWAEYACVGFDKKTVVSYVSFVLSGM